MTNRKVKYSIISAEEEERINYLMPDIVLAVEALQLASADRVHRCLEECDIRASTSQIVLALDYGCRLGLMEERVRYRLNPELLNRRNCFVECPADPNARHVPPCCMPKLRAEKDEEMDMGPPRLMRGFKGRTRMNKTRSLGAG